MSGLLRILAIAVSAFAGAAIGDAQAAGDAAGDDIAIVHERDLIVDPKVGYGAFAWRPDSKAIAFNEFLTGRIGVIDVATGARTETPNMQLNGISTVSWSADGTQLAVNSPTELKIVRMSDAQLISHAYVFTDFGGKPRFGHATAFSDDGKTLFIQNANDDGNVILYAYDIEAKTLRPLILSPFGARKTSPSPTSGRFQRTGNILHYSTLIRRLDEMVISHRIVDRTDYGVFATPSTCFVFAFGPDTEKVSKSSIGFPDPGEETNDGSRDVLDCRYSQPADTIIAKHRGPYNIETDPPKTLDQVPWYFVTVDLKNPTNVRPIGIDADATTNRFFDFEPHPTEPWLISIAEPLEIRAGDPRFRSKITIWALQTGRPVASIESGTPLSNPQISPDGSMIAFAQYNATIALYKITRANREQP